MKRINFNFMANYRTDWTMLSELVEKHIPIGKGFGFCLGGGGFIAYDFYLLLA